MQLEKRSGEFRREQKVLSRISGLSDRDHTLEAVVRKLGVNRQQSLAREELGNRPEYGGAAVWPLAARTQQATVGFFNI
jgi:hypothetical protein